MERADKINPLSSINALRYFNTTLEIPPCGLSSPKSFRLKGLFKCCLLWHYDFKIKSCDQEYIQWHAVYFSIGFTGWCSLKKYWSVLVLRMPSIES